MVAQYEPDARTANQSQAYVKYDKAQCGVRIAAAVIEQFPVKWNPELALSHGQQQAIDLALVEIPLCSVPRHKRSLPLVWFEAGLTASFKYWAASKN